MIMNSSQRQRDPGQHPQLIIRIVIISIILFALILNAINGWGLPKMEIDCVKDSSFIMTEKVNYMFGLVKDSFMKHLFQIVCSLSADALLLICGYKWITNGKNYRFVLALGAVYIAKGICGLLFQLRTPIGYIWYYPGFPSISVSYNNSNCFFFSTTLGMLTVVAREFYKKGNEFLMLYTVFTMMLLSTVFVFLRAHYVIDLVYGAFLGDFFWELFNYICYRKHKATLISYKIDKTTADITPNE